MKKITIRIQSIAFALMLLTSVSNAQTWSLVDNTLFGGYTSLQINGFQSFKNNFYAACGHNNSPGSFIFSSATGDTNTWYQQFSFGSLMNANEMGAVSINATTAGGGWLYVGTHNSIDGPLVCKSYDGVSWDSLPHIPYSFTAASYNDISSVICFNPAGPEDDTLFAAVSNGLDGAEIWKNYYLGGMAWQKVFDFPAYTTGRINDIVKFNNKLYACTNTALIYESADGNNWAMNMPADTGFNDPGNSSFSKMVVFQNRLYVATLNTTTGPQIWNTSDGITWTPIMTDGFGNGSNLQAITDMMVANGKLWVDSYSWLSGGTFTAPTYRGGFQYTYIHSSADGSTFTNQNNDGFVSLGAFTNRSGHLGYFSNFIYQGSENTGWGQGELWRVCQAPTPVISPASGTACLNITYPMADTLSTANNSDWYVDDTLSYTGSSFFYYPMYVGSHIIKLIESNGTCVDSTSTIVTVYDNPSAIPTSFQTYCYGDSVLLFDTISGGTGPYTVSWDDEIAHYYDGNPYLVQALGNMPLYCTVTDANGCWSFSSATGYDVTPLTDVSGHVSYSGGPVTSGTVVAYKYKNYLTEFDTVQITSLDLAGNYLFTGLNHWDYIFKVFADTTAFPTLIPTYYGNTFLWDSATIFTHDCAVNDTLDIVMSEEQTMGGPGFLRGQIKEGPGFGRAEGDPIPGIDVKLGHNPGGQLVINTQTGSDGYYYFTGVPLLPGSETYTVYVDIPGLARDSSYSFQLNASTPSYIYLDYLVDTNSVYIDPNAGVGITNQTGLENHFNVYPNPSKGITTIEYSLNQDANVSLGIYNILGVQLVDLINENQTTGNHKYTFNSKNYNLSSGIYFITLINDGKTSIHRLVITE